MVVHMVAPKVAHMVAPMLAPMVAPMETHMVAPMVAPTMEGPPKMSVGTGPIRAGVL